MNEFLPIGFGRWSCREYEISRPDDLGGNELRLERFSKLKFCPVQVFWSSIHRCARCHVHDRSINDDPESMDICAECDNEMLYDCGGFRQYSEVMECDVQ